MFGDGMISLIATSLRPLRLEGGRVDEQRQELAHAARPDGLDLGQVRLGADRQLGVGQRSHEFGELGGVGAVHRFAADVRLGVARAVPVEVVAARTPAAAVVLGDGHLEVARVVRQLDRAEGAPDRQLPADVGLECVRLDPGEDRVLVQRAAGAGGETGTVEEDARAVDDLRLAGAVLLLGPVVLAAGGAADGVVLPLVLAELLDGLLDALPVVLLGEVGAEGAAAVVGPAGVDALAAVAEDARPAAREPRQVAAVALVRVGGVGELDPDAGEVQRCFSHRLTLCRRHWNRARRGSGRGRPVARGRPPYAVPSSGSRPVLTGRPGSRTLSVRRSG